MQRHLNVLEMFDSMTNICLYRDSYKRYYKLFILLQHKLIKRVAKAISKPMCLTDFKCSLHPNKLTMEYG